MEKRKNIYISIIISLPYMAWFFFCLKNFSAKTRNIEFLYEIIFPLSLLLIIRKIILSEMKIISKLFAVVVVLFFGLPLFVSIGIYLFGLRS